MATPSGRNHWILEVVRGRDVGRLYQVRAGETMIGNALAGSPGFDLADQEPSSPRRMAGQHACLTVKDEVLSIRDLESPGGTFVNRQRLLAGQVRSLQPGDVIQLGGVQLEVKRAEAQQAQPAPSPSPQRGEGWGEEARGPQGTPSPSPQRGEGWGEGARGPQGTLPAPSSGLRPPSPQRGEGWGEGARGPQGEPPALSSGLRPPSPGGGEGWARGSQSAPHAQSKPEALSIPFTITGGSTCKTWDDFLILAAQRWALVRDELTSGRIADHLRRAGRADLVPRPDPNLTADEQLDAWLARLPTNRSSDPELDVHPQSLLIRAATGGGVIHKSLRITNVGYRLLRSTVRVEPAASTTIRLAPEFAARSFLTIDHTDIPIAIELPENTRSTTLGTVVIESNGGTRRIEVLLERPALNAGTTDGASVAGPADLAFDTRPLGELIAAQPVARRLIMMPLALLVFRLLVLLAGWIPVGPSGASGFEPRLGSIAILLAAAGALLGAVQGSKSGDRYACGFTGAMAGLLAAAVGFAFVRSVESLLGGWASSPVAALLLWALLGVVIALLSWLALPPSRPVSTPPPEPST